MWQVLDHGTVVVQFPEDPYDPHWEAKVDAVVELYLTRSRHE